MAVTIDGVGEINGVVLPTTGFGKVLQVVRATDVTQRATTSATFVDVTGMAVTITPQRSTSNILIIASFNGQIDTGARAGSNYQITNAANTAISGANKQVFLQDTITLAPILIMAYDAPATTSATTYKLRFSADTFNQNLVRNDNNTGQMYAIEVSA